MKNTEIHFNRKQSCLWTEVYYFHESTLEIILFQRACYKIYQLGRHEKSFCGVFRLNYVDLLIG